MKHACRRNAVTTLFAALNMFTGQATAMTDASGRRSRRGAGRSRLQKLHQAESGAVSRRSGTRKKARLSFLFSPSWRPARRPMRCGPTASCSLVSRLGCCRWRGATCCSAPHIRKVRRSGDAHTLCYPLAAALPRRHAQRMLSIQEKIASSEESVGVALVQGGLSAPFCPMRTATLRLQKGLAFYTVSFRVPLETLPTVQSCPRRRAGVARDERPTDAVGNSCQTLRTAETAHK